MSASICDNNKHYLIEKYKTSKYPCLSCLYEVAGKLNLVTYIRENIQELRCTNPLCDAMRTVNVPFKYQDIHTDIKCDCLRKRHPGLSDAGHEFIQNIEAGTYTIEPNDLREILGSREIQPAPITQTQSVTDEQAKAKYEQHIYTDMKISISSYWTSKILREQRQLDDALINYNSFEAKYNKLATAIIINPHKLTADLFGESNNGLMPECKSKPFRAAPIKLMYELKTEIFTFDRQTGMLVDINYEEIVLPDIIDTVCCIPFKCSYRKRKVEVFREQLRAIYDIKCNMRDFRHSIEIADLYTYKRYIDYGYDDNYYERKFLIYSEKLRRFGFVHCPKAVD